VGVILQGADDRILEANPAAADLLGLTEDELFGRTSCSPGWGLVGEDGRPFPPAEVPSVVAARTGRPVRGQVIGVNNQRAGTRTWLQVSAMPRADAAGRVSHVVVTLTDVTPRKRAEEAVRASEDRLHEAARVAGFGVFDHDIVADTYYWSPQLRAIYGYPADAPPSVAAFLAMIHPGDREAVAEAVRRCHDPAGDGRFDAEHRLVRPSDGEVRRLAVRSQTTFAGDGPDRRPVRTVGATVDVTDARDAERAVRASEERLRLAVRAANVGLWDWDVRTGRVVYSPEWKAQLGYAEDEIPDQYTEWESRVHPDDLGPALDRIRRTLEGPAGEHTTEVRMRHKDGSWRWIYSRAEVVRDAAGAPVRMLGGHVDVTDRRRAEAIHRENEERQAYLLALADALRPLADPTEVMAAAVRVLGEHLAADQTVYAETDPADPDWFVVRRRHRPADTPAGGDRYRFADFGPTVEAALRDGRTVVVADVAAEFGPAERAAFAAAGPRAFVAVPLAKGGRVLACLVVYARQPRAWAAAEIGLAEETAERTWAAAERAASEERYRRLVDVLPGAIMVHAGGTVVFANPACGRLLGAGSADELVGRPAFAFAAPEYHPAIRERLAAMRATGRPAPGMEMRVVRRDGRTVPVYTVSAPAPWYGPDAYLVALSDLTDRERAVERLRAVMASVGDAIVTIDATGRIESANPATERLFGYPAVELVGRDVGVLMPEPDRGRHGRYLADYLRTGVAHVIGTGREIECLRKDGSRFPADLTVTEFRLDGGRHFAGVVRDITARKRLEEQYRQAQKMEAIGQLAGGVAHDFNNLLTVINGYTDLLLLDPAAADPGRDMLTAVRDAGERAAALTSQLLAFSRKAIVAPKAFDLRDLLAQSERLLRRLIGEDVRLAVVAPPAACRVFADPNQIDQVVMNLAVNARDAMPQGGRLTLACRPVTDPDGDPAPPPGRYVELSVADTGTGMPAEVRAHIFEPFFTTKEAGKGTGLGLATVYGIVRQAGGQVTLESEVGRGTTFRVLLPEAADRAADGGPAAVAAAGRGTETVLLVEDDDGVRELSRVALESQGYAVLAAAGGREALAALAGRPGGADLLVTDVVMPGMSGRELADAVRATAPGVRVLYVSGYTDDAIVRHGVREGADAFLQKPFTPLGLVRKVRAVLDGEG
jgi:PAS domain S-box-containing protein